MFTSRFAIALLAGSLAMLSPALAEKMTYSVDLTGKAEVPPNDSAATGKVEATYDTDSKQLDWTVTHEGLSADPTAAHFHGPAPETDNAGPMVNVDVAQSPLKGSAVLNDEQAKALADGMMYFNLHSAKFPDGEIRGQLKKM